MRRPGRAGARHLQRLPGADRDRLLPGALMRNAGLHFVCRRSALKVENSQSLFTAGYDAGEDDHASRSPTTTAITRPTPKRSTGWKAKAASRSAIERSTVGAQHRGHPQGNVLGMMPHPERAVEAAHGGTDGRRLFEGLLKRSRLNPCSPAKAGAQDITHMADRDPGLPRARESSQGRGVKPGVRQRRERSSVIHVHPLAALEPADHRIGHRGQQRLPADLDHPLGDHTSITASASRPRRRTPADRRSGCRRLADHGRADRPRPQIRPWSRSSSSRARSC